MSHRLMRFISRGHKKVVQQCIVFTLLFFLLITSSYSQVVASFSLSKTEDCVPLIVSLENTSTKVDLDAATVHWSFGNGNQSIEKKSTQAVYTEPGVYQITMTLKVNGKEFSETKQVIVHENPQADFQSNIISGCTPLAVDFQDLSHSPKNKIVSWVWDFGNGVGSDLQHPQNIYHVDSENKVTLVVEDDKGCKDAIVKVDYIVATQQPQIDFTYKDTTSCKFPIFVPFEAQIKSNHAYKQSWDFGNGLVSNQAHPTAIFIGEGSYEVALKVENEYGCVNTLKKDVTVEEKGLGLEIISNSNIGCAPFEYTFKSKSGRELFGQKWSIDTMVYFDSVGVYTFNEPGEYIVELLAIDALGCEDVITEKVIVHERPTADFTMDNFSACSPPLSLQFQSLTADAVVHFWDFGDAGAFSNQENPSYSYDKYGEYDVTYVAGNEFGCLDTLTKEGAVSILAPLVSIEASLEEGCVPFVTNFHIENLSEVEIKSIEWTYPDGSKYTNDNNPPFNITNEDTYEINATVKFDDGNCIDQNLSKIVTGGHRKGVDAKLQPTEVCVKEGVSGQVYNPDNKTKYTWHMGDGSKVETENLSYEYSDAGIFNVFIETNYFGCRDSVFIDTVKVLEPQAAFVVKKLCESGEYQFTNRSIGSTYSRWDFGDGVIKEIDENVFVYKFDKIGKYKVKLYVENSNTLCKDSMEVQINFNKIIHSIELEEQKGCVPHTAKFELDRTEYKTYHWVLEDTIEFTGDGFEYTFADPGKYDVFLKAVRNDGCEEEYFFPEIVNLGMLDVDFDFTPAGGCAPITVDFSSLSVSDSVNMTTLVWDVDDHGLFYDNDFSLTFNENKDISVTLSLANDLGCEETTTKVVPIFIPKADFTSQFNSICTGAAFEFQNTSKGVEPTYLWDFGGDGTNLSTEEHPTAFFLDEGEYDIKLVITDANNCKDSITKTSFVTVENFTYDFDASPRFKSCPELISKFEVFPSNIAYKDIHWDFGNGNQSLDTNKTPVNIYAESGIFDVNLVLEDYRGCKDTVSKEKFIEVKGPRGKLSFSPVSGCLPLEVEYSAEFVDSKLNFWDFGDGVGWSDDKLQENVNYTYKEPGKIIPSLILDDGLGCRVTLTQDSIFVSGAVIDILSSEKALCNGGEVVLYDNSTFDIYDTIVSRSWNLSSGDTGMRDSLVAFLYVDSNQFITGELMVETQFGCVHRDTVQVRVYAYPEVHAPEELVICKGDSVQLKAEGAERFIWSSLKYYVDTSVIAPYVQPIEDTWFYALGYNTELCKTEDSIQVKVVESFFAHAEPDTILCLGASVRFNTEVSEVHSGEFYYKWRLNGEEVSDDPAPEFSPEEDGVYIVNVKNGSCKERNLPVYVRVLTPPSIEVYKDTAIALGQSVTLNAYSNQKVLYEWSPTHSISCATCPNPTVSPKETTEYNVVITNEAGCVNEGDVIVDVIGYCAGVEIEIPNVFTPNNDGLNDVFRVQYDKKMVHLYRMRIYNRYGEMIFETNDVEKGWDGTTGLEAVNTGVYVYYIEAQCPNETSTFIKGNVTLLR